MEPSSLPALSSGAFLAAFAIPAVFSLLSLFFRLCPHWLWGRAEWSLAKHFQSTAGAPAIIVGHRAGSGEGPENTCGAAVAALVRGARGVHFDVAVSRDGHACCCVDDDGYGGGGGGGGGGGARSGARSHFHNLTGGSSADKPPHQFDVDKLPSLASTIQTIPEAVWGVALAPSAAAAPAAAAATHLRPDRRGVLPAGNWGEAGRTIPTLDDVFALVPQEVVVLLSLRERDPARREALAVAVCEAIARHDRRVDTTIVCGGGGGGPRGLDDRAMAAALRRALPRVAMALPGRAVARACVLHCLGLLPFLPLAWALGVGVPRLERSALVVCSHDAETGRRRRGAVGCLLGLLPASLFHHLRARGVPCIAGVVNSREVSEALRRPRSGLSAVITDFPARAVAETSRSGARQKKKEKKKEKKGSTTTSPATASHENKSKVA